MVTVVTGICRLSQKKFPYDNAFSYGVLTGVRRISMHFKLTSKFL